MRQAIKYVIIFGKIIFFSGWIIPFYISAKSLIDWCNLEVAPAIYHYPKKGSIFPLLDLSEKAIGVTCIWLIIVFTYIAITIGKKGLPDK